MTCDFGLSSSNRCRCLWCEPSPLGDAWFTVNFIVIALLSGLSAAALPLYLAEAWIGPTVGRRCTSNQVDP
jgi:hypothetical protein